MNQRIDAAARLPANMTANPLHRPAALRLLLMLLLVLPGAAAASVDIAAAVGFTDTFRPGHWTPLAVTVSHRGGSLRGELEVQVTADDASRGPPAVTYHRRPLELHGESRKTLHFTVFPQGLSHPLVIRVYSGGRELARSEVDLRTRFVAQRLLLVLSRNVDLDYLNEGSVDGLRVLYPHPELLPLHWRAYDAVAAIVLHGVSLERMSPRQYEALHKWIAQGGTLAISGGPDYALLRSPRLAGLLPGVPAGMTSIETAALHTAFSDSLDISQPVHVHRLDRFEGHVRHAAGDTPLVVERRLGRGRVLYLTFDVARFPFDRWEGMKALWLENLKLAPSTFAYGNPESVHGSALAALIRSGATEFPRYGIALLFVLLYLGVLLAFATLSRRTASGAGWAWLPAWLLPALFASGAWLLFGPQVFPRSATAAVVALIEPLPGTPYARLAVQLGLYGIRDGPLRFAYGGAEPVLYRHREAAKAGRAADWVLSGGTARFVEPLQHRRYVLHALEGEDVIPFHIDADARKDSEALRLVLRNASGRKLEALWVVFDERAYEIGTVAAGERVERRFPLAGGGVALGEVSWRRLLEPDGIGPRHSASPIEILLERKAGALGETPYPGPGHAALIANVASPFEPSGSSAEWPRSERALVVLRVRVAQSPPPAKMGKPDPRAVGAEGASAARMAEGAQARGDAAEQDR